MTRFVRKNLAFYTCATLFLLISPVRGEHAKLCGIGKIPPRRASPIYASDVNLPPADTEATPVVIDVMFLYTPDAITGAGAESVLQQRIQEAIEEANYNYTNSRVNISINPVYMGSVDYTESGDIQTDLDRLGYREGAFSGVDALREDYKADVVCLITELENAGIGGLAWDIPPLRGNPDTAFFAVRRQALGRNITVAHELGHLLGCAHDREHAGDPNDPFYLIRRPYIFGNRLEVEGVTYIDVMAYEPGVAMPYFANPQIQLDGVPLGIPEGETLPSDTARTINETAPYVAAYKQALSRIEFDTAQSVVLQSNGGINLHLRRSGDLTTTTRVTIGILGSSTAQPGVDYILPGSTTVQFASGDSDAFFVIPLIQTQNAGTRTLRARLTAPLGTHGVGLQGETTVSILDKLPVARLESASVRENSGTVEITPTFLGPVLPDIPKITWHLESDSAVAGADFVDASGELTITVSAGAYQIEPIHISIIDDTTPEPDKVFKLIVDGTTYGGVIYGAVTNEIRIVDDDRPGSLEDAPGAQLNPDGPMHVAVRDDHKALVWGGFSKLGETARTGIALLNADGTVDASFQPPELLASHRKLEHFPNASISSLQVLPDNKLLVAGEFSRADGKPRSTLARLNADGSLDDTFGTDLKFDGSVDALRVQPDGKILVGGAFENINGERRAFVARLNSDGTVDSTFAPNGGPTSSWTVFVLSIALQNDGKILIGGLFEKEDGVDSSNLARLNPDGTLDATFQARNVSGPVMQVNSQSDGRIVLAGLFDTIDNYPTRKLARLNSDGSIDETFQPPLPNAEVREVITLPDGRLLVSGAFTTIAGTERRFVTLLNSNGTLDTSFDLGTGPDERVGAMSIHGDGSLYLPGRLQTLDGMPAASLARVRFGPAASAITDIQLAGHGDSILRAAVFPGGLYRIERSDDLIHWTETESFTARGFSRQASVSLSALGAHEFLRLMTSPE